MRHSAEVPLVFHTGVVRAIFSAQLDSWPHDGRILPSGASMRGATMRSPRPLALIAAIVASATASVAACGGGNDGPTTPTSVAVTPAPAPTPTPAPSTLDVCAAIGSAPAFAIISGESCGVSVASVVQVILRDLNEWWRRTLHRDRHCAECRPDGRTLCYRWRRGRQRRRGGPHGERGFQPSGRQL